MKKNGNKYIIMFMLCLSMVILIGVWSCRDDKNDPMFPAIMKIEPSSGAVGTTVIISGKNFRTIGAGNKVTFNGIVAKVKASTAMTITAVVPVNATTGKVVVEVDHKKSIGFPFTVTVPAPTITKLNPSSGVVGTTVTITGTNFSTTAADNTVSFNGTAATVTASTATSLTTTVPAGATTGDVIVKVKGKTSAGSAFTVTVATPTITKLNPGSGPVGSAVTITGTNFSTTAADNKVSFNGTAATVTASTATSLTTTVPAGATTGDVVVEVDGKASAGSAFTVTVASPTITKLNPGSGPVGSTVTITGTNFSTTAADNKVSFNGTAATVTASTATSLTTTVPAGATTGDVVVEVDGKTSAGSAFTVTDGEPATPTITKLNPATGPVGSAVTITGTGFSTTAADNTVSFNGTAATVTASTATSITTTVPAGATTGDVIVKVNDKISAGAAFTVTDGEPVTPTITKLNPATGVVGTTVIITGTGFSTTAADNTVSFNGTAATVTASTATSLTTTVPAGATTGDVIVKVNGKTSAGAAFTVTVAEPASPTITKLNPGSGVVGTTVIITGTGFSTTAADNTVSFNGTAATVTASTATSLTTTVPAGATTGDVVVEVDGKTSAGAAFTVTVATPTITKLNPGSGAVGTTVTITGTGFSTTAADNTVSFNGTAATVTASTATSITTTVPAGATTGDVSVTVNGKTSAGSAFTVTIAEPATPTITKLNPGSGVVGTTVTITGTNFSATAADNTVSFNGTVATVSASTATSITTTVPAGATTGDVTVKVNGKTSAGSAFTVTVAEPATPTITDLNPDSGPVGTTVTITGTNFSATAADNTVSFNGTAATVSASTATSITTSVPAGAATGDVTVKVNGKTSAGFAFTVTTVQTTLTVVISEGEDDVEEGAKNGAVALYSSDLELGEYDTYAAYDDIEQGVQTIGLRFNNITIPKTATIEEASIQFTCDNTGANPVEMTIYGEDIDNAPAYTNDYYNVSDRDKTTAKVVWDIPEWVSEGDAGDAQKTGDLKAIIQEIINRNGWTSGNSLSFIIAPTGATVDVTSSSGGREAESRDSGEETAPVLKIIYNN